MSNHIIVINGGKTNRLLNPITISENVSHKFSHKLKAWTLRACLSSHHLKFQRLFPSKLCSDFPTLQVSLIDRSNYLLPCHVIYKTDANRRQPLNNHCDSSRLLRHFRVSRVFVLFRINRLTNKVEAAMPHGICVL